MNTAEEKSLSGRSFVLNFHMLQGDASHFVKCEGADRCHCCAGI